jgi:hypothetical protein
MPDEDTEKSVVDSMMYLFIVIVFIIPTLHGDQVGWSYEYRELLILSGLTLAVAYGVTHGG